MKLIIFTICKNEAKTVKTLLKRIPRHIKGVTTIETYLIDDGSTDDTAEIARRAGASVISDGKQKRLAHRFRQALAIAIDQKADIMVNIDGDLQFSPEDIPKLVEPIVKDVADFVAADRFTKSNGKKQKPANMPTGKYYGNALGAWVVSKLSGQKFNDVTCGFRAYSKEAIIRLNINGDYTYTQESFQIMAIKKLRIATIPTQVKYFKGRKSRVVTSIPKFIATSAINIIRSYRDFAPLRFFGILGFVPFTISIVCIAVFVGHWLVTGSFSPYKFLGFLGAYFITMAVIFWLIGLSSDMQSRSLNNQEKILEEMKRARYDEG